jgi:nucleoside phosphorylase
VANVVGMRRLVALLAALALVAGGAGAADAKSKPKPKPVPLCPQQTLVLSAMPVELNAVLARLDRPAGVTRETIGGHDYYLGRSGHASLVLTLTGIGPANARRAVDAAADAFRCGHRPAFREVVFSGVSGGDYIGDVVVPSSWAYEFAHSGGLVSVDDRMLATARRVFARVKPHLLTTAPAGDPACGCQTSPDAVTTVAVQHAPAVEVGGRGLTTDPFSGRELPCVPGGGDVFGCAPCIVQTDAQRDGPAFATGAVPFLDPSFFTGYFASSGDHPGYVAQDEESAAADDEAHHRGMGFLAFRGVSDGGGDPLSLPGFPAQFFYYRQLAADNAAIATLAFLAAGG